MGCIEDEGQAKKWLLDNGFSREHTKCLLEKNERTKRELLSVHKETKTEWTVGNMHYTSIGKVISDTPLEQAISFLIEDIGNYKCSFEEFKEVKLNIRESITIKDLCRLLMPFSFGEYLIGLRTFFISLVVEGSLSVELFPWQNYSILFLMDVPVLTSRVERIWYYSELPWEYQEQAVINIDILWKIEPHPISKVCHLNPEAIARIWRSYLTQANKALSTSQPTKKTRSRKAIPLRDACLAVWRKVQDSESGEPVDASQLINFAIEHGVNGYRDLRLLGSKIIWGSDDGLEFKHFVKAFADIKDVKDFNGH